MDAAVVGVEGAFVESRGSHDRCGYYVDSTMLDRSMLRLKSQVVKALLRGCFVVASESGKTRAGQEGHHSRSFQLYSVRCESSSASSSQLINTVSASF